MRLQIMFPGMTRALWRCPVAVPIRAVMDTSSACGKRCRRPCATALSIRYVRIAISAGPAGRHFAYPDGVGNGQVSHRVKNLGILLYVLGLSYREVSHVLGALGVYFCKSRVCDAVKDATNQVIGLAGNLSSQEYGKRTSWMPSLV